MMLTREGSEIDILVRGEGRVKALTEEDLSVIIDTRANFKDLLVSSASKLDLAELALLIAAAAKSVLRRDYLAEKKELFLRRAGFKVSQIEIGYKGKRLKFNVQEKLLMQMLYQVGSIFIKNSYMADEKLINGNEVVDAGANFGIFSFMAYCLGASKVHAFEPVKPTFAIMESYVRQNGLEGAINPVNKALGESSGQIEIRYDGEGDLTASLLESTKKSKSEKIEMVSLDSFFREGKVSFIKMDTEGYESEIISGGAALIARCKPAMCLSAYHKKEDRRELPALISKIRPDYKLEFINFGEENLFCT